MPMWVWIAIGLASWVGLSVLLGFGLARIFGAMTRTRISEREAEYWATLAPTSATREVKEQRPELAAKSSRLDHVHHQARDALNALRREVEADNLSAADIQRAREALLRLSDVADQLNREIATMEQSVARVSPPRSEPNRSGDWTSD
jgi:SepF-like predicted cell division protein (DUF552 family)